MAVLRRDLLVGAERVGNTKKRETGRGFADPSLLDDGTDRATLGRLADEFVAVEVVAAERDEEFAGVCGSRVRTEVGDEPAAAAIFSNGFGKLRELV
jgi:hypothetical protein